MLSEASLRELLEPFGVELGALQLAKLSTYLELLVRWNRKINLTAVRKPEDCVTRHFGESFFLVRVVRLEGSLLDVGSGAGFPGLALKIPAADVRVSLLEPVAKKRAFLKEVVRMCAFENVEVRGERLEDFVRAHPGKAFDFMTSRAVGEVSKLASLSAVVLKPGGRLCLWLGRDQAAELYPQADRFAWADPIPIPLSRSNVILLGTRS